MFWLKPQKSRLYRAFSRRAVVIVAVAFLPPTVAKRWETITLLGGFWRQSHQHRRSD